jgi:phosphoserine phosphatase RsbU/P
MIRRAATGTVETIVQPSFPLAVRKAFNVKPRSFSLDPGDLLLLYSDGLPETFSPNQIPFGYDRLADLLSQQTSCQPEAILATIEAARAAWSEHAPPTDDISVLVLVREPAS